MRRALLFFAAFLVSVAAFGASVDVALLAYSGEGATTTPVIANPLTYDVSYPGQTVCAPIGGCRTTPGLTIKAGEVVSFADVTPPSGIVGAYHVSLADPGLIAYSEIVTGNGALFRIGPLTPVDHVRYLDATAMPRLINGVVHNYNGWMILIAADGPVTYTDEAGTRYDLTVDQGALVPTPKSGKIDLNSPWGKFYAVVGINDPITGSQQLVTPH